MGASIDDASATKSRFQENIGYLGKKMMMIQCSIRDKKVCILFRFREFAADVNVALVRVLRQRMEQVQHYTYNKLSEIEACFDHAVQLQLRRRGLLAFASECPR